MAKKSDQVIPAALVLPSEDDMRARAVYLREEIERIEAESAPLRAKRDELVNRHGEEIRALETKYKDVEKTLYDNKTEYAALVRLLKGGVEKPAEAPQPEAAPVE